MRSPFLALVAVFLLSLTACGDTSTDKPSEEGGTASGESAQGDKPAQKPAAPAKAQDGAESPEALIAMLKTEFEKPEADMSVMVPVVLPEHRGMLAFAMGLLAPQMAISMGEAMAGMGSPEDAEKNKGKFAKMKEGFEALLKKHGVKMDEEAGEGAMMQMQGDPEAAIKTTAEMFEGVDHAAFIKDSMAFMKQFSDGEGGMKMGPSKDDLSLEDVQIEVDGDKAVATAKGEEEPLHLLKKDGRWFIDFMAMMKK